MRMDNIMNIKNLSTLTWDQLDQISNFVQKAKFEKKKKMELEAKKEILNFLDENYPEIDLISLAKNLLEYGQYKKEMKSIKSQEKTLFEGEENYEDSRYSSLLFDVDSYIARLKVVSKAVLGSDETRLLWLTNDGGQKTSNVSGKELSAILQETIKKIERLSTLELDQDDEKYIFELFQISRWSEEKLGISLIKGTFTVISPCFSRNQRAKETIRDLLVDRDSLNQLDTSFDSSMSIHLPGT